MAREAGPDFIEALARGLDVLRCFRPGQAVMTLSEIAGVTGLARPTVRRILLTLEELGYVRVADRGYALTPRVLELGMSYINSLTMWDVARPHMQRLVGQTGESTSMAQLDGGDIVYVARVAVPKIVTLAVTIGTRFPAPATSMGKVLLAALDPADLDRALAEPGRSGVVSRWQPDRAELDRALRDVRAKGWALADQDLAPGIRSVATGVRNGDGRIVAALNVTVHAADTSVETLVDEHLPRLLRTAADISRDWALRDSVPLAAPAAG
ncbi:MULTISPECIES: IclR family transcriptional regulator C-terminal domain-containing protein [unclassified Micromonospora]|jgi:IclR family pca regulon transcriptional regulator|nr:MULTISPECIES: IclR family transcriptional regulator C-terminal domain-containing protein [unclassified Micromonospora]MDG4819232.1 IclR family transcriptional regulator C-terminal domain-containing protein [Micromonospora sp. WMMD956]WFE55696.1 IclR family transcriptional regulator C-terminal domain-containing protein [Micromonospora sp. WMMD712]